MEESMKPKIDNANNMSELDYFQLLFSNDILEQLASESNKYYQNLLVESFGNDYKKLILAHRSTSSLPYLYLTRGITKEDILAYIGVRIFMGIHKLPSFNLYWKKGFNQTNINQIMSRNYFILVGKSLHFPETEKKEDDSKSTIPRDETSCTENESKTSSRTNVPSVKLDPRHKIQLYLEKLALNFQKYYQLGQNITIDESLLLFKGRNSMKFYIPMKPHKWGFKIHLLCDSDTSYLYNLLLDPGKTGKEFVELKDNSSFSESIVLRLVSCITDKRQRNLFCDGWYSSISLMKKLTNMGYLVTTVLRNYSKEIPSKLKSKDYDKAYNDEILIQKYEGKKTILFATNYEIEKEKLRNIYNIKNRGVDTFDHYLAISSIQRMTRRWYKKIILFGVDASLINAKIICELKTGKSYTTVQFKEKIYEQIFRRYKDYQSFSDIEMQYYQFQNQFKRQFSDYFTNKFY